MKKVLALSLVLVLFASLATIAEEAPKPDVTASKVKIKYFPQSQWKPTYMEVRTPAIMFCGQEVKTEFAKERLKIEGRNLKPSLEPVIFTIQKGEEERYLGIVHHEGKWVYYNATLEMVKHRKEDIVIYGYDMDCDDSYFNPKRDGMVYPDSTSVVPFEGIPFWYIDKSVDLVKTPDGYKMTSKPLECEDEELAALQLINRIRVDAGIHAVFLNKELSAKCRKHAHYVAVNGADEIDTPYQGERRKRWLHPRRCVNSRGKHLLVLR
ncbi:MAG: hypothetical protein U5N86_11120 [Planctomycetota bacterium]|nr:hypothetical protein [Planctomycetota bacterium]